METTHVTPTKTPPKYYLVIDLEATCDEHHRIPREETEIIEIGAVLCDGATLAPAAEFQTFVRPMRHAKLTPFCTRLTSITQAQVDAAPRFAEAIRALADWLRAREAHDQLLFCSWGDYDKNQLGRQARKHGLVLPLGAGHLNLKEAFRKQAGDAEQVGNGGALRRVGLRATGTAHRGIDDARNISQLLPYCLGRRPVTGRR